MQKPPTANPDLPSFVHPNYLEFEPELQLTLDCWRELKGVERDYLPKEPKEPPAAYKNRLGRAKFDSRFAPAIRGYAGLLGDFAIANPTESIEQYADDVDQQGNSLSVFLNDADETALRDGGCFVLVEFPPEREIESNLEQIEAGDRPYLVLIDRRDVINWSFAFRQGLPVITMAVIREQRLMPVGEFGVAQKTCYRVLRPGSFEVWEMVRSTDGQWTRSILESGSTSLDRVPLIWYSLSCNRPFWGLPPFLTLARLNIEHHQKRSSLNEVLWKCNLPVAVRKGAKAIAPVVPGMPPVMPPLTIGPNVVIDIPESGDFFFAEPSGNAIASTQADIEKLEAAMDRISLAFLTGGEAQKTATEVVLDTAQAQATIRGMAEKKRSAVEQIFDFWLAYTGEAPAEAPSIDINAQVLQLPPNPEDIRLILENMGINLSTRLSLQMLLSRGWIPRDADIEAEEQMRSQSPLTPEEPDAELRVGAIA